MSEWTWVGTLGVGLLVGFGFGRAWPRREGEPPMWQRLPLIIGGAFRSYMLLIYFAAAMWAVGLLIKDVVSPSPANSPPAVRTDPAPLQ